MQRLGKAEMGASLERVVQEGISGEAHGSTIDQLPTHCPGHQNRGSMSSCGRWKKDHSRVTMGFKVPPDFKVPWRWKASWKNLKPPWGGRRDGEGWESGRGPKSGIRWTDRQHEEAEGGWEMREGEGRVNTLKVAADKAGTTQEEGDRGPLFSL